MRRRGTLRATFGAVCIAAVAVTAAAIPANADSVPFNDQYASGAIGFCNQSRQPVTSGNINDVPFVWTAVSSANAPSGYAHGKATLYAFQPRKDVDPGDWSGRQLTAASSFSNPNHPMAQATYGDSPLLWFVQAFPPKWDGLVQLRLFFSGIELPLHQSPYPAAVIRVSGNTWTLVSGSASPACTSGTAISGEAGKIPASIISVSPRPTSGSKVTGAAATRPAAQDNAADPAASSSGSHHGSGAAVPVALSIAGAAALGSSGGVLFWRRRRRSPRGHP